MYNRDYVERRYRSKESCCIQVKVVTDLGGGSAKFGRAGVGSVEVVCA